MYNFSTLEFDIKKMLQGEHGPSSLELSHESAKHIVTLAKNIATHTLDLINHKPVKPKDKTDRVIRISELGEPCLRKLMYKWYMPEYGLPPYAESPTPFLPVKFTYGDYIEELTLFLATEAGHLVQDRQMEVTIGNATSSVLDSGWYAVGHIDATIDGTIVDVKSAADGSFSKYKREGLTEDNDTFGYRWQLDGYSVATGNIRRAFIFTNKHDGEIHIINRSSEDLLDVHGRIKEIGNAANDLLIHGNMPPKLPTKKTKYGEQLGTVCSYCAFKWTCYSGNVLGLISSGRPLYFDSTTLTKEGHDLEREKTAITTPEAYTIPF